MNGSKDLGSRLTRNGFATIERTEHGYYLVTKLPNLGAYYQKRLFDSSREAWRHYYGEIKYEN